MKIHLDYNEIKNILESLNVEEITKRKDGFYPQWVAYDVVDGWELQKKQADLKEGVGK